MSFFVVSVDLPVSVDDLPDDLLVDLPDLVDFVDLLPPDLRYLLVDLRLDLADLSVATACLSAPAAGVLVTGWTAGAGALAGAAGVAGVAGVAWAIAATETTEAIRAARSLCMVGWLSRNVGERRCSWATTSRRPIRLTARSSAATRR